MNVLIFELAKFENYSKKLQNINILVDTYIRIHYLEVDYRNFLFQNLLVAP